ncbi:MAG: flagellar export chaperone FlgN [Roseburia sp.]
MSEKDYIAVLKQSLAKKVDILDTIHALNVEQKRMLEDPQLGPEELEENFKAKGELVEQLTALDDGFEQVYDRVKEQLISRKEQYAADIAQMQKYISRITDRSADIRAQEQRNKTLMQQKFSTVKKQIREVKSSRQAVDSYYKNMMKMNYVDPQFMDNKK